MKTKLTPEEYELLRWLKAQDAIYNDRCGPKPPGQDKFTTMYAFYIGWAGHAHFDNFTTFLRKAGASRKAAFKNFLHAYTVQQLLGSDRC